MMKKFGLVMLAVALALGGSRAVALDSALSITSPDRPAVWYNPSGMKVSQNLTWEARKQQLVLHLAYDRVEFTPQSDQTYYDTFKLSFPMVHFDASNNRLFFRTDGGRRVDIGHLEPGIMGTRAVLDHPFQVSAHRLDGHIEAAIKSVSAN